MYRVPLTGFLLFLAATFSVMAGSITDFRWQNRILIFYSNDDYHRQQMTEANALFTEEIKERRLLFVILSSQKVVCLPDTCTDLSAKKIIEEYRIEHNQVTLIGLDGGVKQRIDFNSFTMNDVFDKIDTMPMRRAELDK